MDSQPPSEYKFHMYPNHTDHLQKSFYKYREQQHLPIIITCIN